MAFPVYESVIDTDFSASATSMPVNMPATVNAGDLLIALVEVRNAGTWTKPTGWSDISTLSQGGGGSVGKLNGFYKIADGTEDSTTPTWTASVSTTGAWVTIRVSSWHGTTPPEATTASGDATNANPPSLTPSWGAEDTLWLAIAANSATGDTTGFTAAPTNYSNLHSNGTSTGGSTCNVASSTRGLNATSDDPGTFTPSSNRFWASATIGIRPAPSGIAFDAASNSAYNTADALYSWAHTCTGSNRYLVVGVSMLSVAGSNVSGVTYGGVAMTFLGAIASGSGAIRSELWGLISPATGSNTVEVTLSAALDSIAGATSFTGVNQTSPIEGYNSATATNVGAADATVNVTTVADNDWVVDCVATSDTAITVGAGQTSRNNVTGTLGSGAMSTEGPKTPAGSVTMNWTDVGAAATWSIGAIGLRDINAASLGGSTTRGFMTTNTGFWGS